MYFLVEWSCVHICFYFYLMTHSTHVYQWFYWQMYENI